MDLYITGAGVSADSGIPTFRGEDGFWTIGSKNYTPQEMATRKMYLENPTEFLSWYYLRFAKYRNAKPNSVHFFLSDKKLITQNIDGLDKKAGNKDYISIHGNLNEVTFYYDENKKSNIFPAPWDIVEKECPDILDKVKLKSILLNCFKISNITLKPTKMVSLKPFVLLFDELYSNMYKINYAEALMKKAKKFVFMGTSFSVNITLLALKYAISHSAKIEIIDPYPLDLGVKNIRYYKMLASEYIQLN